MAEVSFGEWLKRRRGAEGWTQKQLAQRINCSISALRKMEAEERRPSVQVLERFAEIFNIPQNERKSFLRFARGDWQALSRGETEDAPWRILHLSHRSNLPASITSFIGREKEQDEIIGLIAKNRMVTLAGVGGIGKTRLSLQVGQKLLNDYHDGVWFIPLDSLSNPTLVPQTVASVFEIRERPDHPVIEILINVLREKTVLLILDNCEHLMDSCAQLITALLTNCPNLKILATSREILNMKGEATYYLPSLSIPEDNKLLVEQLTEYESVQLFTERATLALSSFRLTTEIAQTVVNICRKVDGIPLTIELAAARVNILKVEEILKQLNDSFVLLASDSRGTLPRHETLQASMDWSWGLLTESEQTFMRQLSVFAGGWTLDSAQVVCECSALNLISSLVKKSLIMVDQKLEGKTRYRFHEIVRQYMRERLIESGEEENVRTSHLKYFLELSEQAEPALRGPEQIEWMSRLNDERDNIRAALEWAEQTDIEAGLFLSGRMIRFWENFDVRDGARWLAKFLQHTQAKQYPLARAKALCTQARMMFDAQDYNFANIEARESLDLYRANGDQTGEIDALLIVGLTGVDSHVPLEEVLNSYEQALKLAESLGDSWRQAYALAHIGLSTTHYQRSISALEKAVAIFEKVGDLEFATEPMLYLVMRHMLNGNLQLAQKWLDKVAKTSRNLNNKGLETNILHYYGCIALIREDYESARANFIKALNLAQALGHRVLELWTHVRLGYLALREGDIEQARDIFAETTHDFLEDQNVIGVVFTLEGMASLHTMFGKATMAARILGWADSTRVNIHDLRPPLEQADVNKLLSACMTEMGETTFLNTYNEGQKMSLNEAIAYALKEN